MRIWRLTLLSLLFIACSDQPPTAVDAPDFRAAQGDRSEYTLVLDFESSYDGVEYGQVTCLGEGTWFFGGTHYRWWSKEVLTPSGNRTAQGYLEDANAGLGSFVENEYGDLWYLEQFSAPIAEVTRHHDGNWLAQEQAKSVFTNDAGEVRIIHESFHIGPPDMMTRYTLRCQAVKGGPQR